MKIELVDTTDDNFKMSWTTQQKTVVNTVSVGTDSEGKVTQTDIVLHVLCDPNRLIPGQPPECNNSFSKTELKSIGDTIQAEMESQQLQTPKEKAIPLNNPKSNNFDFFAGTSWEGKKQGFN
jgi:hypothetical protein